MVLADVAVELRDREENAGYEAEQNLGQEDETHVDVQRLAGVVADFAEAVEPNRWIGMEDREMSDGRTGASKRKGRKAERQKGGGGCEERRYRATEEERTKKRKC